MSFAMRSMTAPGDLSRLIELLLTYRVSGYVRRYPTLPRVELLFNSRIWDLEQDSWFWEDETGQPIAGAFLWKRSLASTTYVLERIIHPAYDAPALSPEILHQAKRRVAVEAAQKQITVNLAVMPQERQVDQDRVLLENHGFERDPDGYNVYMAADLTEPVRLPDGGTDFKIRALQEADLERYQAAYGFTAVKTEHLRAQLASPEYQQLVAETPDGQFAGYVECSYSQSEWAQSPQRVGWIDYIQTLPDFQRRGLGAALMLTGLDQIRTWGGQTAMLITASENHNAQATFKKAGMIVDGNEYVYSQEFRG